MFSSIIKKLGSVEKSTRDEGFAALKSYLIDNRDLSDLDFRKVWSGLYSTFWLSDKVPIQHQLASNLADVMNQLPIDSAFTYFSHFWLILMNKWGTIDSHRMDKFYYLIRQFLAVAIGRVAMLGWKDDLLSLFISSLMNGPLLHNSLTLHCVDCFVEELKRTQNCENAPLLKLLQPFLWKLSQKIPKNVSNRIISYIFTPIFAIAHDDNSSNILPVCAILPKLKNTLRFIALDPETHDSQRSFFHKLYRMASDSQVNYVEDNELKKRIEEDWYITHTSIKPPISLLKKNRKNKRKRAKLQAK